MLPRTEHLALGWGVGVGACTPFLSRPEQLALDRGLGEPFSSRPEQLALPELGAQGTPSCSRLQVCTEQPYGRGEGSQTGSP